MARAQWTVPVGSTLGIPRLPNAPLPEMRGIWWTMHRSAIKASEFPTKRPYFDIWVRDIIDDLQCKTCKAHGREYLQNYPVEQAADPKVWVWQFHNAVNQRLNKPLLDWAGYSQLHLTPQICESDCGH